MIVSRPAAEPPSPRLFLLCVHPPPPQQSVNDKRKKNLFTRKFPFYKSKEPSEQETSDLDRKYRRRGVRSAAGRERSAGGGADARRSSRQRGQAAPARLYATFNLIQTLAAEQEVPPPASCLEPKWPPRRRGDRLLSSALSVCRWNS